ncbi:MAG: HEAT repeat domain-containing protein [Gemmatimonadota bacterium]
MSHTPQALIPVLTRAYQVVAGAGSGPEDMKEALTQVEELLGASPAVVDVSAPSSTESPLLRDLHSREVSQLVLGAALSLGDVVRFLRTLHASQDRESLEAHLRMAGESGLEVRFRERGHGPPGGLARSIRELFPPAATEATPESTTALESPPEPSGSDEPAPAGSRKVFHAGVLGKAGTEAPSGGAHASPDDTDASADLEAIRRAVAGLADEEAAEGPEELEHRVRDALTAGHVEPLAELLRQVAKTVTENAALESAGAVLASKLAHGRVVARVVAEAAGRGGEVERARFLALARLIPDAMAPALGDALADDLDRRARRLYLETLSSLGDAGLQAAVVMLDDPRWFVVRNGVSVLGELGDEGVTVHLTQALGHSDSRVRREAVMALAKMGGDDADMLLLGMLGDGDPDVRSSVILGLGVLRVERAQRPLLEALEKEQDDDLIIAILRTLGQLGDPGAVPAIEKRAMGTFFTRPPTPVRIAAYRALAAIGTPHARSVLEDGRDDKDPAVKAAILPLLAAQRGPEGREGDPPPEGSEPTPPSDD